MKFLTPFIALSLVLGLHAPAEAAFPERSINLMNPYLAGGILEVTTRPVVEEMSRHLGRNIAITNHAGAGGTIGLTKFSQQKPDGYTITVCSDLSVFCPIKFRKVRFTEDDFTPIGSWATTNTALVVKRGDARFQTFADLLAYAAAHRGQTLSFGMTGKLGLRHAALAQLLSKIELPNVKLVPFGGDLDIVNALGGGHIDAGVLDMVTSELVMPVGFFGKEGCPLFPDVPSFAAMGYDIDMAGSYILWAHKNIPADRLKVLRDAMKASVDAPAVKEMAVNMGLTPRPMFDGKLDAKIANTIRALDELIEKGLIVPEK